MAIAPEAATVAGARVTADWPVILTSPLAATVAASSVMLAAPVMPAVPIVPDADSVAGLRVADRLPTRPPSKNMLSKTGRALP